MITGSLCDSTGVAWVHPCQRTNRIHERMRGLLGRPAPKQRAGFLLSPCSSVHTFGMAYAIDVIFLDARMRVLKRIDHLKPWRLAACWRAYATLELASGEAAALGLVPGLQLAWQTG